MPTLTLTYQIQAEIDTIVLILKVVFWSLLLLEVVEQVLVFAMCKTKKRGGEGVTPTL